MSNAQNGARRENDPHCIAHKIINSNAHDQILKLDRNETEFHRQVLHDSRVDSWVKKKENTERKFSCLHANRQPMESDRTLKKEISMGRRRDWGPCAS